MVFDKLIQIWKAKDLRKNILFVLAMLVIFRIAAHIPIPGVNPEALRSFFDNNQILGLLNVFSGGSMQNFSIVMMGIAPYITASIIFQLLGMIIPKLEQMQKEESGRQKINMWTRWLAVPLSFIQAYSLILLLSRQGQFFTGIQSTSILFAIISMTAGTIFLMWLGELITEKNIGNGISIIILSGIVAGLPTVLSQSLAVYDKSQLIT